MEKYTVDIDKVLDAFEESEALEVNQPYLTSESHLAEQEKLLTNIDVSRTLPNDTLYGDCLLSDSGVNHCVFQAPQSNTLSPKLSEDATDKLDLSKADSWNYEIYYKSFQASVDSLEANQSDKASNAYASDLSIASNAEDEVLCVSLHRTEPASIVETILSNSDSDNKCLSATSLCVLHSNSSKERKLALSDSVLSDSSAQCSSSCHELPVLIACCNEESTLKKYSQVPDGKLSTNQNSVEAHEKVASCTGSQNRPYFHEMECGSECAMEQSLCSSTDMAEETGKLSSGDVQCLKSCSDKIKHTCKTDFPNLKGMCQDLPSNCINDSTPSYEIDQGMPCSQNVVGFSDVDEECDLSLDEMKEYLNDLSDVDQVQDEDSGVSSQEDINGNNFPTDSLSKESDMVEIYQAANLDCGWKTTEVFEITKTALQQKFHSSSSCKQLEVMQNDPSRNDIDSSCSDKNRNSNPDPIGPLMVSPESFESTGHIYEITETAGENPQKEYSHHLPVTTNDHSVELSNSKKNNLVEESLNIGENSNSNFCFLKKTVNSESSTNYSTHTLTIESQDSLSVINNFTVNNCEEATENSIVSQPSHLMSESTLVEAVENLTCAKGIAECFDSINGGILHKNADDTCEEALESILDSTVNLMNCPPRLQRPTTLDLPSRGVAAAKGSSSFCKDIASPVCDVTVEEPATETLVVLNDTSPSGEDEFLPPSESENALTEPLQIGIVKPFWIPDADASNCMHCNIKFTVIKRRHHCRACGKVLCSRCCNQKARLPYLQNKEDRVCQLCIDILSNVSQADRLAGLTGESPISSSCGSSPNFSPAQVNPSASNFAEKNYWRPHPNNPDDYCSTIPPLQQVQSLANIPPPTVMVPIGVLKRGNKPRGEPKQVIFSDGIRPGGDLTDLTEPLEVVPPYRRQGRRRVDKVAFGNDGSQMLSSTISPSAAKKKLTHLKHRHKRIVVSDSEGPLPPILLPSDYESDDQLDLALLLARLRGDEFAPVVFAVTKNMHVLTKVIKLDCCFGKECWCFTSHGLCTVGQDEIMLVLESFPEENIIPRDAFRLFSKVYDNASKGSTVGELGHIIFPDGILGSWEHRGFLFVRPTLQCLSKLVLPSTPFLVAILIQKWEVPWAKVFPLRLMLRLGAECRYYPCALVSIRFRKSVYFEIGQTIMSVLADLRNYQFTIPVVPGLVVHMEEKKTCVNIPRNRYEKLMKVLNSNNVEHVLALGSNFSTEADSHLVCMQKDEGDYQTQAINIEHTTRRVTGASFIVFSGALKSSTGLTAKFSIVEDGLLVQIPQEMMTALHSALRDMRDLTIKCGPINAAEPEEVVIIQWTRDDKKFNLGVRSPVDGKNLEGVQSLRIHTSTDYAGDNYLIRWTEVFFLELDENGNHRRNEAVDPCRLAESVAQACCMALTPYLDQLADAELTRIGLRVTLDSERDKVEYDVGAQRQPLPSMYMNALDSSLIPVISRISGTSQDEPIALELILHILIK